MTDIPVAARSMRGTSGARGDFVGYIEDHPHRPDPEKTIA